VASENYAAFDSGLLFSVCNIFFANRIDNVSE
jgi:hypothetical protein